jgi:O-acetyl-ADP-ribose deacetylase (regulator of RNase III)
VDGAIHRAGGPEILNECKLIIERQGKCKTGEAVITGAGRLHAKYVIHTVGPVWNGGTKNEAQLLANAYTNSLQLAAENGCNTIAFPNISTGVYGYPKKAAAAVALKAVNDFINRNQIPAEVIFVCYDDENLEIYREISE